MKRLALAVAVVALVACKRGEEAQPAADTTSAAPAAPAPADTGMMADTMKMMGDTVPNGMKKSN
jgi:hypothetical protein